jgi:FAD-dependent urate hydroxylase
VARPNLFRWLPMEWQKSLAYRSIRPAASGWLQPLVGGVTFYTDRTITSATRCRDRIRLRLSDDSWTEADHVLLATGYCVDISRYRFLDSELLTKIKRVDGYPRLSGGLESSVAGLHFLGATAAYSFGPLMRFVSGTGFAASALTRGVLASTQAGIRPEF